MKKQLLGLFSLITVTLAGTLTADAAPRKFAVCSGTEFTLKRNMTTTPTAVASKWTDLGGAALGSAASLTNTIALTDETVAEKRTYLLSIQAVADGCWSDFDTIEVYVLPQPKVTITGGDDLACSNEENTILFTAVPITYDFSVLPATPTFSDYAWTSTAGTPTTGTGVTYSVTTSATTTVEVSLAYNPTNLAATYDGVKVPCVGTASKMVTVTAAPGVPEITFE